MIRIVAVQRSSNPDEEFVLLQNQGGLRLDLRGHVVVSESAVHSGNLATGAHVFSDSEQIPAGMYVMLRSGVGLPRWARTKDGSLVYYAFAGSTRSLWGSCTGPLHVLARQHTFSERRELVTAG